LRDSSIFHACLLFKIVRTGPRESVADTKFTLSIRCASSVFEGHDCLALECWRGERVLVFEIFRNDETQRYEVTLFEQDVPLELLEYKVLTARDTLGNFVPTPEA
jgi:hypothetical protein